MSVPEANFLKAYGFHTGLSYSFDCDSLLCGMARRSLRLLGERHIWKALEDTTLKAGAESARSHDKAFKDSDLESIESWNSTLQTLRNKGRSHSGDPRSKTRIAKSTWHTSPAAQVSNRYHHD